MLTSTSDLIAQLRAMERKFGVESKFPQSPALILGGSLLEQTEPVLVEPKKVAKAGRKTVREVQNRDPTMLGGAALTAWCHHFYRLGSIGFERGGDCKQTVMQRILSPSIRYIVFLDLDETLTATNECPIDAIAEPRGKKQVDEYMHRRVPPDLRKRVKSFLATLSQRSDVDWFILTDNVYPTTRCTMKLAFGIDTGTGTIIDRAMRDGFEQSGDFLSKAQFIAKCNAWRKQHNRAPVRIVFADNAEHHRTSTEAATSKESTLICCNDLSVGLSADHIRKIYAFLEK